MKSQREINTEKAKLKKAVMQALAEKEVKFYSTEFNLSEALRLYNDYCSNLEEYQGKNPLQDFLPLFQKYRAEIGDGEIVGDLLVSAAEDNDTKLFKQLLSMGMAATSRTTSINKTYNNLNALNMMVVLNKPAYFKMLLDSDVDFLHVNSETVTLFNLNYRSITLEMFQMFLDHLKKKLNEGTLLSDFRAVDVLHMLSRNSLFIPNADARVNQIVNEICVLLKRMIPEDERLLTLDFKANDASNESFDTHDKCHEEIFGKSLAEDNDLSKESAIRKANSKLSMLFQNPERCIPHLRFLNDEFERYLKENYPNDEFSPEKMHPDSFEFVEMAGLRVPVGKENYAVIKKYSRLQEFLQLLLKKHGMGDEVIKWVGFISQDVANRQMAAGNLVLENVYGGASLFHGALSHMIQAAIMIYAFERHDLVLPNDVTLKDLIYNQVYNKDARGTALWAGLRDRQIRDAVKFNHPHRLNSVLMSAGATFPALSAYLIATFISQSKKIVAAMTQKANPSGDDIKTIFTAMSNLNPRLFYPSPYIDTAIRKYEQSNRFLAIMSGKTDQGTPYATAVRKSYPYAIDFKLQDFDEKTSLENYEVLAPGHYEIKSGEALYINIITKDTEENNTVILRRMYYDNERRRWIYNLPKGITAKSCQFEYYVGPFHPVNATVDDNGLVMTIGREHLTKNAPLQIENDAIQELQYLADKREWSRLTNRIQVVKMINPDLFEKVIYGGRMVAVKACINCGANILQPNNYGVSPFGLVLQLMNQGDTNTNTSFLSLKVMLELVPQINPDDLTSQDKKYITLKTYDKFLELAKNFKQDALVKMLHDHPLAGANIDASLQKAFDECQLYEITRLVAKGANVHLPDGYGISILEKAIKRDMISYLEVLMTSKYFNIAEENDKGQTLLGIAIQSCKMDIVNILIQAGATINAKEKLELLDFYVANYLTPLITDFKNKNPIDARHDLIKTISNFPEQDRLAYACIMLQEHQVPCDNFAELQLQLNSKDRLMLARICVDSFIYNQGNGAQFEKIIATLAPEERPAFRDFCDEYIKNIDIEVYKTRYLQPRINALLKIQSSAPIPINSTSPGILSDYKKLTKFITRLEKLDDAKKLKQCRKNKELLIDGFSLARVLSKFKDDNNILILLNEMLTPACPFKNGDEVANVLEQLPKDHRLYYALALMPLNRFGSYVRHVMSTLVPEVKFTFACLAFQQIQFFASNIDEVIKELATEERLMFAFIHADKIFDKHMPAILDLLTSSQAKIFKEYHTKHHSKQRVPDVGVTRFGLFGGILKVGALDPMLVEALFLKGRG